jgi:hypothetical protein
VTHHTRVISAETRPESQDVKTAPQTNLFGRRVTKQKELTRCGHVWLKATVPSHRGDHPQASNVEEVQTGTDKEDYVKSSINGWRSPTSIADACQAGRAGRCRDVAESRGGGTTRKNQPGADVTNFGSAESYLFTASVLRVSVSASGVATTNRVTFCVGAYARARASG